MIPSGSHVPGIDGGSFGLPEGTALRYERPDAPLQPFFASYAVLDSDPALWATSTTWTLPNVACLWIAPSDAPLEMRIRNRRYASLGRAMLLGPTSRAVPVEARGGVSVLIHIRPRGWARWFAGSAETYRDRATPLEALWPIAQVETLLGAIHVSDHGVAVKGVLDRFLIDHLPAPAASEDRIERAAAILSDPTMTESNAVAAALGISEQTLLRLTNRTFGFGPKMLMRRRRFLRALTDMMIAGTEPDSSVPPPGYHDVPHFLRDGRDFLGQTPRRFLAQPMPYLRASVKARARVIGSAWPPLDRG